MGCLHLLRTIKMQKLDNGCHPIVGFWVTLYSYLVDGNGQFCLKYCFFQSSVFNDLDYHSYSQLFRRPDDGLYFLIAGSAFSKIPMYSLLKSFQKMLI